MLALSVAFALLVWAGQRGYGPLKLLLRVTAADDTAPDNGGNTTHNTDGDTAGGNTADNTAGNTAGNTGSGTAGKAARNEVAAAAGSYARPLISSTRAVSDTKYTPNMP